jgi:phenylalanyl-tRNA synthetase beta chain
MPKIQVYEKTFYEYLGFRPTETELTSLLERAKGELDARAEGMFKIELKDTNRPDLWSAAGLARQIRALRGQAPGAYAFLSDADGAQEAADRHVVVDPKLREIRPYIAALAVRGRKVTETMLLDIIEGQEALCRNYGRKRKSIAMGVHREELIRYPISYHAADPRGAKFTPLGMTEELSLEEILARHPKGQEFGWILKGFPAYPLLRDAQGGVLSFPPVINGARIGAVAVGDDRLFVDLTGTDIDTLLLALNIVACDFQDMGFEVLPVRVSYPYDTKYGRTLTTPYRFQSPVSFRLEYAGQLLGVPVGSEEAVACLRTMGLDPVARADEVTVEPPPYRNDFLHPADLVEEIMIGRGMESFEPIRPRDFTVGRLDSGERFARRVVDVMVGLGYQEMVYNYLCSIEDTARRMRRDPAALVRIANPMTESYEALRDSILPNLLASEAVSGNAVYPHRMFEVGKVCLRSEADNYGCVTRSTLGLMVSSREAGFNDVRAHVAALLYYLGQEHVLSPVEDPRFIPGRCVAVLAAGKRERLGVLGEIHPEVLESFGVQMPCAAAELDLDTTAAV